MAGMVEKLSNRDALAKHLTELQKLIDKAEAERLKLRVNAALCGERSRILMITVERYFGE